MCGCVRFGGQKCRRCDEIESKLRRLILLCTHDSTQLSKWSGGFHLFSMDTPAQSMTLDEQRSAELAAATERVLGALASGKAKMRHQTVNAQARAQVLFPDLPHVLSLLQIEMNRDDNTTEGDEDMNDEIAAALLEGDEHEGQDADMADLVQSDAHSMPPETGQIAEETAE